jgi:hypothetical protein
MTDDGMTKPTLDTVLERVNAIGDALTNRLSDFQKQVEGGFNRIESQITALQADLRKLYRKIEILNDNILNVQANHRDLLVRVEDLESKAS